MYSLTNILSVLYCPIRKQTEWKHDYLRYESFIETLKTILCSRQDVKPFLLIASGAFKSSSVISDTRRAKVSASQFSRRNLMLPPLILSCCKNYSVSWNLVAVLCTDRAQSLKSSLVTIKLEVRVYFCNKIESQIIVCRKGSLLSNQFRKLDPERQLPSSSDTSFCQVTFHPSQTPTSLTNNLYPIFSWNAKKSLYFLVLNIPSQHLCSRISMRSNFFSQICRAFWIFEQIRFQSTLHREGRQA